MIDALRGFSLIGICLIHSMQHFGANGDDDVSGCVPVGGNDERNFQMVYQLSCFREVFHYFLLSVRLEFLYPDGSGGQKRGGFPSSLPVEIGVAVGHRLFARLVCPGGHPADICVAGLPFGVDV